jgi:hypothetical protein
VTDTATATQLFARGFHEPGDGETRLGYHVGLLGVADATAGLGVVVLQTNTFAGQPVQSGSLDRPAIATEGPPPDVLSPSMKTTFGCGRSDIEIP